MLLFCYVWIAVSGCVSVVPYLGGLNLWDGCFGVVLLGGCGWLCVLLACFVLVWYCMVF